MRAELGVADAFVVGHVGNFSAPKNHVRLIEIFESVLVRRPNSVLVLVGDGVLRPVVDREIAKRGLGHRVLVLGGRADVCDLLQAFDVFVLPSLFEGFPVVLVEAQASGLPCIVSDTITDEVSCGSSVIFLPLSSPGWAEAICSASVEDRTSGSQQVVKAGFDAKDVAIRLRSAYEALALKSHGETRVSESGL